MREVQTRPEINGSFAAAASTHWLATSSAMSVLERGGNAFDAAVAAGFVMQVVEPHLSGPAGDLAGIVWDAGEGAPHVVCGQGVSPQGATIEHFRDLGLDLVPGSGPLAAVVPGAFGAWIEMLQRWGTWELADVLAYAIGYAEHGFPLLRGTTDMIAGCRQLFLDEWTPSAEVWLNRDGTVPAPGTTWTLPELARTYRRLIDLGVGSTRGQRLDSSRQAFYEGFVAEEIAQFSSRAWRDSSGEAHAGLLTTSDLGSWRATIEAPVEVDVAGRYRLLKTGPWGQGPVLAQQARLWDAVGLFDVEEGTASWVHLLTESAKLAFADREAWYGDPLSVDVPLATLLSREYAEQRASLVRELADPALRPGSPDGRTPRLANLGIDRPGSFDPSTAEPTLEAGGRTRGDTCHVDVVDRWGNLVSVTPSGGWLQSSPVIPALGFPLGTRAQMFHLEPGLAGSLRPGVRPRTTLTPSIALRDGVPWAAFGTPGGDQQDQWQAAFFARVISRDTRGELDLQSVIDAPMHHSAHFPSSFWPRESHPNRLVMEDRFPERVVSELRERGHDVHLVDPWSLGRLSIVAREGSRVRAAANARGAQGYAVGR